MNPMATYASLGVREVVNANSWVTRLGGSEMPDEALQAMSAAAHSFIDLDELNKRAGDVIARHTGAEAGLVTAGASAGMLLQAAAVMAGSDPGRIKRLPDTTGIKNEIVIHRVHRVGEDRNYLTAGASFVEIGNSGGTEDWELEAAIGDKTAAVAYIFGPPLCDAMSIERVVEISHAHGVPVIVDAAAMLPPQENLKRFVAAGADLVTFSGGKGVRGPQSTGILCGRADLVEAARCNGSPNQYGIGRAAKVCKEEIAGLIAALEVFVNSDYEIIQAGWRGQCEHVLHALDDVNGVTAFVQETDASADEASRTHPRVHIFLSDSHPKSESQIIDELRQGSPPIWVPRAGPHGGIAVVPVNLRPGEEEVVASRLRTAVSAG